jgi:hypothetical protein
MMVTEKRSIALTIVLTLVTCGIYGLYWQYALTKEVAKLNNRPDFNGGIAVLLTLVTCGIYGLFWVYQLGQYIQQLQTTKGMPAKDNSLMYVILSLFGLGIVAFAIAQNDLNELV